ncbi:alpha/beta hydrolase [Naasia aerilata]|uniref:Alpha/beta hydrolase n=1 Tax=Naasia aerilata TaxID=1162966 RepID=A0ABN6XRR6_9MICO|nr:alpha/beta hydrolase [Naasia aerilata]
MAVQSDLVYETVDGENLALDAYLPARPVATPTPAIVVVHGGSFTSGDKAGLDAAPLAALLAQAGYAAFSIDYRLLPEHPFPDALEDLQAAVEWLRAPDQATRFGIDPARIGAFGGSAGAILVAEAGTAGEGPLDQGSRFKAVVELSGIMDLTPAGLTPDLEAADYRLGLAYLDCTDPDDCPASEAASPLANVDPTDPPFYLAHSVDEELPEQSTVAFADALTAAGVPVQLELRPGAAHSVLMLDSAMSERILAFFAQHL